MLLIESRKSRNISRLHPQHSIIYIILSATNTPDTHLETENIFSCLMQTDWRFQQKFNRPCRLIGGFNKSLIAHAD